METRLNHSDHFKTKNSYDRDNLYVRAKCMETRLNHPDHLTKNSVTEVILTLELSVWKPGLIIQIT